ncbi:MAG: hypothetical protein ACKV2Q_17545 [Planctomycetaceae bacterium]
MAASRNYTPYQDKIIKRFYDNRESIDQTRLSDLAAELYLAEGKKRERLWKQAGEVMERLGVPQSRLDHVLKTADPAILAEVVQDIQNGHIKPPPKTKPNAPTKSSE